MTAFLTAAAVALTTKFAPVVPDTTYPVPGLPADDGAIPSGYAGDHGPYTGNAETLFARLQLREQAVAPLLLRSHPAPFADRDRFLANLFGPQVEWLPPRTASQEQWREWCLAAEPPRMNIYSGYREPLLDNGDPVMKVWLATSPGPSWRTLTEGSKEPEWTVIYDKDGKPIGRQRVAADGVEFYF